MARILRRVRSLSARSKPRLTPSPSSELIPGVSKAVIGMAPGDAKTVEIPPEEAYGPRHDQLIQDVPRNQLPDDMTPAVGMELQAQNESGQVMRFSVTAVDDESITVDGNHPLAGEALNFDIELVEIV